jgi:uncharacterized RDD family membrane protein YckC
VFALAPDSAQLAFAYDLLALIGVWVFLGLCAVAINGGQAVVGWPRVLLLYPFLWLATGAYFAVSWRHGGQTLGMRPWRLRVTRPDGTALLNGQAWLRYLCGWLSALPAGAGMVLCLFDPDRRALHDHLAGTRVGLHPKPAGPRHHQNGKS